MEIAQSHIALVVPYIGTWIETGGMDIAKLEEEVVPYIGTWIETRVLRMLKPLRKRRTLYRYVD